MTKTRVETIPLTDGSELRMTVAEPDNAVRGGVVVLHESQGVTERVLGVVGALAEEGWLTVAPHLYHRLAGLPSAEEAAGRLTGESVLADTDASFAWLADQGIAADRMGVVGFDLGGTVACVVAGKRRLGAVVSCAAGGVSTGVAPGLPALLDIAGEVNSPWLALYGERDGALAPGEVGLLREAAGRAGVATDIVSYPDADHRFDTAPEAAAEAWQRTLNWLDAHLR